MAYYEEIKRRNITLKLKRLLQNGGFYYRDDGKIDAQHRLAWDQPWHHVRKHPLLDCYTWHSILFDVVSMNLPSDQQFVPANCQSCFKVVVRPKTLKQLFALLEVQKCLDLPSKCGIEIRETVHALYGGYFYNIGLKEGLECYKIVRKAVDEDSNLGKDVSVILKRGCTEYEHALGPSDNWEVTEAQLEYEMEVKKKVARDDIDRNQPEDDLDYIHLKWIEWAWFVGDDTYLEFTDGPLHPPYVTYHHLAEEKESKDAPK